MKLEGEEVIKKGRNNQDGGKYKQKKEKDILDILLLNYG